MWKHVFLAISLMVLFCARDVESWRRRRRRRAPPPCSPRNCAVSSWSSWGACSHLCGTSGSQRRTRSKTSPPSCGGSCPYHFQETRACNRDKCQNGGTPHSSGCNCRPGYQGTCCEGGKCVGKDHVNDNISLTSEKHEMEKKINRPINEQHLRHLLLSSFHLNGYTCILKG